MLADNNLEISDTSKSVCILEVKRGLFWSKRRVELETKHFKYFDPSKFLIFINLF